MLNAHCQELSKLTHFYTWFQPKAKHFWAPWTRTYQYCFQLKIFLWVLGTLKKLMPLFYPTRSRTKTNYDSLTLVFQCFASATYNYFKFCWFTVWSVSFVIGQMGYNWKPLYVTFTSALHWCHTLACSRSSSAVTNSAVPFPALATPFTSAVDAPDPMPNVKHLQ